MPLSASECIPHQVLDGPGGCSSRALLDEAELGIRPELIHAPNVCTATYTTLCALGVCTPFLGSLRAFLDSRACKCDGHVQLQPKALTTVPTSSPPAALSVGGGAGGGVVVGVEGPPTAPESAAFGVVFADYCCSLYAGYHAVELSPVRDLVTLFQPGYLAPRAVLAVTLARADEGKARFPQQVRAAVRAAIQASAMTGGSWEREGVDDGEGFGNGVGADDEVGGADKDGEDDFGGGDRSDKDGEGKEDGRDGEGYVGAEGAEDGELPSMGGEEEGDQDDANVLCGRRRRPRARRLAAFNGSRRWTLFRDFRAVRVLHFNRQRRAHLLRPAGIGTRSSNFPRSSLRRRFHTHERHGHHGRWFSRDQGRRGGQ